MAGHRSERALAARDCAAVTDSESAPWSAPTTPARPLIDSGGTVQNLQNLIPANSGYELGSGVAINGNGEIVAASVRQAAPAGQWGSDGSALGAPTCWLSGQVHGVWSQNVPSAPLCPCSAQAGAELCGSVRHRRLAEPGLPWPMATNAMPTAITAIH